MSFEIKRMRSKPRFLALLFSIIILIVVIIAVFTIMPADSSNVGGDQASLLPARKVSVVEVVAKTHSAMISGYAEVRPRWRSTLRAKVSGTLIKVADNFQPGARVKAGQVLAILDSTAWVANLAEANNRLALAEVTLLRERQEATEAVRNWRDSGLDGEPDSRLVLREPQIKAALQEIIAARAACDWASRQLSFTSIRAPFAGVVTERNISRAEAVIAGEPIAVLLATDVFELALPVSESQWHNLPETIEGLQAELIDPNSTVRWLAKVVRHGAGINLLTRMHTIYLEVANPIAQKQPLLPGMFVEVQLKGKRMEKLLELPEGVLTRAGKIWYVDGNDLLGFFSTDLLFTRTGLVYVREPESKPRWRIVKYPLESYFAGQSVQPITTSAAPVTATTTKGY